MNSLVIASAVFGCTAAAGLAASAVGRRLPAHYLETDSREAIRHVTSFLAAMAALVLGLLVASARSNYEERNAQLHRIAADVVALDRALARFGEGANEARVVLRAVLQDEYARLSAGGRLRGTGLDQPVQDTRMLSFPERLQALSPTNDAERTARERAAQLSDEIALTRLLMTQDQGGSIPPLFLAVLTSWTVAMFASFGLVTRPNIAVSMSLVIGAAAVAGAVFLTLELDQPLSGIMRLSTEPLRRAIAAVGP